MMPFGKTTTTIDELMATDKAFGEAVTRMHQQMLIALVVRAGGTVTMPIEEVDGTGRFILTTELVGRQFVVKVGQKQ